MTKQIKKNGQKQVQNVQELLLANIVPNPNNPRKTFDENSIRELADSIQNPEVGLIQPITVRPSKDDAGKYIIIAGERRFRACTLLGWETIPCIVKDVSDEVAMEIAFIENLQRAEVPVMEEAAAYKWLIESGRYDYASLASKVGVSEVTIRKRIKLMDLIPELQEQVDKEVPLGHAEEICKYSENIQREVVKKYGPDVVSYQSFRGLSIVALKEKLASEYTCILSKYHFDQSECRKCSNNTGCNVMFDDSIARCQNMVCLKNKANQHTADAIEQMMQKQPELVLLTRSSRLSDVLLVELLNAKGIEIQDEMSGYEFLVEYYSNEPERDSFDDETEYQQALAEYKDCKEKFEASRQNQIKEGIADGTFFPFIKLNFDEPEIAYFKISSYSQMPDTPKGRIFKLLNKAKREKELVFEKTLDDCRELVKSANPITSPLAEQEIKLIYYAMLESLPRGYWSLFGVSVPKETWKTKLTEEQRAELMKSLTEEQKRLIERAFIFEKTNSACQEGVQSSLFLEWVRLNYPQDVAAIEKKYTAIAKKRLDGIAAKLAVEGEKLPNDLEALRTGELVLVASETAEPEEQTEESELN